MSKETTYTIKSITLKEKVADIAFEGDNATGLTVLIEDVDGLKAGDVVTVNYGNKKVAKQDAGETAKPRRKE